MSDCDPDFTDSGIDDAFVSSVKRARDATVRIVGLVLSHVHRLLSIESHSRVALTARWDVDKDVPKSGHRSRLTHDQSDEKREQKHEVHAFNLF